MTVDASLRAVPLPASHRGRPFDTGRDAAILTAALELIGERGYDRVTMEAIASRAHAGKAALYRRWSSKAELVADAVRCRCEDEPVLPDTGDIRTDLVQGARALLAQLELQRPMLSGLLTAIQSDPDLAATFRASMVGHREEASRAWVRRLVERGQLSPSADSELFHDVLPGVVFVRAFVTGQPLDDDFADQLVDDILLPLLTRGSAAAAAGRAPRQTRNP